jgi:hypothetical protein
MSRVIGTGTIDKVKRGRYSYYLGRLWCDDELGVHRRVELTGKSEAEVKRKLKELQDKPVNAAGRKLTLRIFLKDRFLPGMKLRVRPRLMIRTVEPSSFSKGFQKLGDEGARTPDPLLAKQVLYQLSYIPARVLFSRHPSTPLS